jgi:hypothetical protein
VMLCPGWRYVPFARESLVTRPATGAVMIEYESLVSASFLAGLRGLELCIRSTALCLQEEKLLLRSHCVCLCAGKSCLLLRQVRGRLLGSLLGARAGLHKLDIPGVFLLGKCKGRLRFGSLFIGLVNTRMLGIKLRGKIGDVGLQLLDLRLGLGQLRRVDGIIDPGEDGACLDDLIIVDVQFADRAGNLWADRNSMRVDKGVVRGLELARMQPPENAGGDNHENGENGDCHKPRSMA